MSGDDRKPEMSRREWDAAARTCASNVCDGVGAEMQSGGPTPTPAVAGQIHSWGALEAEILNPQPTPRANQHEDSVVKVVIYGDTRFLFTGDFGVSTESTIVSEGMSVEADVLKVAHHGRRHSSSSGFLEAVGAEVAVVCVADNTYGHPTEEALQRLRDAGAQVCRTDLHGTVVIVSDGQTIEYTCGADYDYLTFLPLVVSQHAPGAPPTPPPRPRENVVCEEIGNVLICGSVSDGTPPRYSALTVYGRCLVNGAGQSGHTMLATWHYKTTTSECTGTTGADGTAQCTRYIAGASAGYQVNVDIEINGYTVTTWFTPQ